MKQWQIWSVFLGVIIFATAMTWLLLHQSIRLDEAQSIWMASKPSATAVYLVSEDVHVPLYTVILHFWMQLFGNSIVTARLLSFLFFLLTLPALYILAKEVANEKVALLTITFFSFSPFILWYTSEARMYTLFTFVTTINHIWFLRLFRTRGHSGKIGYFFTLLLGMFTHYFFFFLIATQGIFVLLHTLVGVFQMARKIGSYRKSLWFQKELFVSFSLVLFAAGICFAPWLVYVFLQGGASNTQPLIPSPSSYNIFQTFVNFLFGFQPSGIQAVLVSLWPLIVILFFFVFTQRRRIPIERLDYFVLATFLPILLVFLISFIRPIFLSRYLILTTPTLFFILAWMLMNYSKRIATYLITGILCVMFGLLVYQNISSSVPVKEDYADTALYLASHATPEDIIAVSAPFTIYPIEYSYRGITKIVTIPPWDRYEQGAIPVYTDRGFTEQMDQYKTQYARIFTVLSYDQGYEKKIRHYMDTHFQLVTHRTFSPGLELRVYKLRYDTHTS